MGTSRQASRHAHGQGQRETVGQGAHNEPRGVHVQREHEMAG